MCNSESRLSNEIIDFIAECRAKEHSESYLISVLHRIQSEYGYLSKDNMEQAAHLLNVPTSTVYGVATFYHFFRLQPRGKYSISICLGTACFVKGADEVLEAFTSELGIDVGETTSDGMFSIEGTRCIGVCALAPVVTINGKVFSNVTAKKVSDIIHTVKAEKVEV